MLDIRGLTVRYGQVTAVDGVDLTVPGGQVLALLGPSGCGKSTLLRTIAGIEHPDAGRIRWSGVDLAHVPVHRRGFGLMFQDGVLFPHRTVAGNVAYGLRGQRGAASRVEDLLEMVGLPGYSSRRVSTLSGGEAQRVALARALAPNPQLLLLDEPLAALDRSLREGLLVDLRRVLDATGTTAVFVTHDQAEAFAIADRLAVMRSGRIVQVGIPAEVWRNPVDEDTARFLGCAEILDADDEALPVGPAAAPGERIGLRPAALVVDPDGPLSAEIVDCAPGPERMRLTVRGLRSADEVHPPGTVRDGGTCTEIDSGTRTEHDSGTRTESDDGTRTESDGGGRSEADDITRAERTFAAVAPASGEYPAGAAVRLRVDPDQLAWIAAPVRL